MTYNDDKAIEAAARAQCVSGGFDPDETMPNDGPRWKYYVTSSRAAVDAYEAAIRDAHRNREFAQVVWPDEDFGE